jgi:RNA polymerase sigma-70 factor (ECF subfamily)
MSSRNKTKNKNREFEKYYVKFRKRIYWYVRKRSNSDEFAEDIAADVFVKLYENFEKVADRGENGVQAWLYAVARNTMIDEFRRKSNNSEKAGFDPELFEILCVHEDETLTKMIAEERVEKIAEALKYLSDEDQEVISMRMQEDLQFNEIAGVLGKTEGAVKMQFYRAIDKIKEIIEQARAEQLVKIKQ